MELVIEKKEKNPLLEREEIKAILKSNITPSNAQVKEVIASKLDKPVGLVVIKGIYPKFGKQESDVRAFVYNSEEALKKFEPKPKAKKGEAKPGEKSAEKPEEKPEEKIGVKEEKTKQKREEKSGEKQTKEEK